MSLKTLEVTGHILDIASLVFRLRLLPTCKLAATCTMFWEDGDIDMDMDMIRALFTCLISFLNKPVWRLVLHGHKAGDDYGISLWTCTHPWAGKPLFPPDADRMPCAKDAWQPNVQIIMHIAYYDALLNMAGPQSIPNHLQWVCVNEGFIQTVQVLDITDGVMTWLGYKWQQLCENMVELQHIRVNDRLRVDLAEVLIMLVPHLKTLTVMNERFIPQLNEEGAFLKALARTLKLRKGRISMLEGLHLQGYDADLGKRMRHLVYMLRTERLVPVLIGESP
ncbi:hypothetical protein EVG20_g1787 [Dentipellis fragilis]|uniref:F-box domain-containing protein n=1 Tax=Dentipellis fragilis TaxID=205917 RepID=A0A4Y9ZBL7_9AGAM|nr:hypothetical protein EVG20_g1787 [Dentipellis fragilis]